MAERRGIMRSLAFIALASLAACAADSADIDNSDQLDAPTGKEDAASKPAGFYTNNNVTHAGDLVTLTLNADHTFIAEKQVECITAPCNPVEETGTYLFTHGTSKGVTKTYIRLYNDDGTSLARYQWQLSRTALQLKLDGTSSWSTLQHTDTPDQGSDNSCQADADCSGILPQFCRVCDDGSTSCAHWSCVTNACQIATCN